MTDVPLDPIAIDVGTLLQRDVMSVYSHLVTRPTGRAVRLAIETRLAEVRKSSLSLVDLSEVKILDFSGADEVVAKLLSRYLSPDRPRDTFFVFVGVAPAHRDPIEVVLRKQSLAAVARTGPDRYELLGRRSGAEDTAWNVLEERGLLSAADVPELLPVDARPGLDSLVARRLAFRSPISGRIHALSRIVRRLA